MAEKLRVNINKALGELGLLAVEFAGREICLQAPPILQHTIPVLLSWR